MSPTPDAPTTINSCIPQISQNLIPSTSWKPTLVVVIDTEEEFDWKEPFYHESTAVSNITEQKFAQEIFDAYGVVPTYAVDYPVAKSAAAVTILDGFRSDNRCEIGGHLHPWVTPPHSGAIDSYHSYGGNLPTDLEEAKLASLVDIIRRNFRLQPAVFRAGRYGIGPRTPSILRQLGFETDVSVLPTFDFSIDGGPDFGRAPRNPYLTPEGVCEMPDSAAFFGPLAGYGASIFRQMSKTYMKRLHFGGILARTRLLERLRLSPEGHTLSEMIRYVRLSHARGCRLFMMSYHSSSLLAGGTPYVRSQEDRRAFLERIDGFLYFFLHEFGGRTETVSRVTALLKAEHAHSDSGKMATRCLHESELRQRRMGPSL